MWNTGATTDPIVVESIIRRLKNLFVEVCVIRSDTTITNANEAFEATGMKVMCMRNSVGWLNFQLINDSARS